MNSIALQERMISALAADAAALDKALATEDDLRRRLDEARDAEAAAIRALEDAQLEAVQRNKNVPGALIQAVEEATRQRVTLEGAIAAFQRGVKLGEESAQASRRHAAEQRVQQAADEFAAAGAAFVREIAKLVDKGAGARLLAAKDALERSVASVPNQVLTDAGWVMNDGLYTMRNTRGDALLLVAIGKMLGSVHEGAKHTSGQLGDGQATGYLQAIADSAVRAARAQPAHWPAV